VLRVLVCWHAGQAEVAVAAGPAPPEVRSVPTTSQAAARGAWEDLERDDPVPAGGSGGVVAAGAAPGARLAGPMGMAAALLARMVGQPAAPAVAAGA
jgi:hypothetical protein